VDAPVAKDSPLFAPAPRESALAIAPPGAPNAAVFSAESTFEQPVTSDEPTIVTEAIFQMREVMGTRECTNPHAHGKRHYRLLNISHFVGTGTLCFWHQMIASRFPSVADF
jgi:hypothetical protein